MISKALVPVFLSGLAVVSLVILLCRATTDELLQPHHDITISRQTELVQLASALAVADTPAENARCTGLLHACQAWLALKDGATNDIVITSPSDNSALVNHTGLMLPNAGEGVPNGVWSVMQEACRYGFSDLRKCRKPAHWPHCTGLSCNKGPASSAAVAGKSPSTSKNTRKSKRKF